MSIILFYPLIILSKDIIITVEGFVNHSCIKAVNPFRHGIWYDPLEIPGRIGAASTCRRLCEPDNFPGIEEKCKCHIIKSSEIKRLIIPVPGKVIGQRGPEVRSKKEIVFIIYCPVSALCAMLFGKSCNPGHLRATFSSSPEIDFPVGWFIYITCPEESCIAMPEISWIMQDAAESNINIARVSNSEFRQTLST